MQERDLRLTQWGTEAKTFSMHDGLEKMTAVENLVRIASEVSLRADCQIAISYGTLLGCMRDGNLISHDYDFDLAFFPNSMNCEDVIATSGRIMQTLNEMGLEKNQKSHGHLTTFIEISGTNRAVDFFAGWVSSGRIMHYFAINGEISETDYFPIRKHSLCGVSVPIPSDSTKVLQAIYGEGWMVPNPDFQHCLNFENFAFLFM
jgi:hypothetical protein